MIRKSKADLELLNSLGEQFNMNHKNVEQNLRRRAIMPPYPDRQQLVTILEGVRGSRKGKRKTRSAPAVNGKPARVGVSFGRDFMIFMQHGETAFFNEVRANGQRQIKSSQASFLKAMDAVRTGVDKDRIAELMERGSLALMKEMQTEKRHRYLTSEIRWLDAFNFLVSET